MIGSPMLTATLVLCCVFGGTLLGMSLRAALPDAHLSSDSRDVVKLGMGLIATMSALVLSLLVASAKGSYDVRRNEITQLAAGVIITDRVLAHYGPESNHARDLLRLAVGHILERVWSEESTAAPPGQPASTADEGLYDEIQALSPESAEQRSLQAQALKTVVDLGQTRWLLFAQSGSSIPVPFLVVLVFWLTILFGSFGMLAPRNPTVLAVLFVSALSVSGALYLVLELDQPFQGLIQISSAPLHNALAQLGH